MSCRRTEDDPGLTTSEGLVDESIDTEGIPVVLHDRHEFKLKSKKGGSNTTRKGTPVSLSRLGLDQEVPPLVTFHPPNLCSVRVTHNPLVLFFFYS